MDELVSQVRALQRQPVRKLVEQRLQEFTSLGKKGSQELYKELCFCTLTANFDAEKSIAIQERVGNGFLSLSEKRLEALLRKLGYRYPNRAAYMLESRKFKNSLKGVLGSFDTEAKAREWLADNVKGLGFKESSHFLRNIGFKDLAIIDFHIVDLLVKHRLIERPKTMTKKRYLEIEHVLSKIAGRIGMPLAELDLYLWHLETGKVLK